MDKYFINQPEQEPEENPNNIGEVISMGKDLLTDPDMVYRSVNGDAALHDLQESGVVRNKQSAGLVEKSRWGTNVYWSRGSEGKYQMIGNNSFIIVAPLEIAEERAIQKEDVVAIYTKDESGNVIDVRDQFLED